VTSNALNKSALSLAANVARGLSIDAVAAASSGHLGLPLGCAEIGAVLYGHALAHDPASPGWINRDRFVLSAGHGSMFLYGWLYLSGYAGMTLDEIKCFRQLDSKTPGHPELTKMPSGVETTSGPLGQGVANAVGMAVSAKMAEARFRPSHCVSRW
jgi:transketolase